MHPHHQIHVLRDRVRAVAAQFQHHLAGKTAKGPGDNQHAIQRAPALTAEQEGPQVLHHLDGFYTGTRQVNAGDPSGGDPAPVHHPHDAADRHHPLRVQHHGQRHPQQCVAFQHCVSIQRTEIGVAGDVDAGVQRIRFTAAIFFVQYQKTGFGQADISGAHRLGLQPRSNDVLSPDQPEGALQPGQRLVLAAVVNHHHFQFRVVQGQQ